MLNALLVTIGGGLGSLLRHLMSSFFPASSHFPYAILTINLLGSFAIGFLAGIWEGNGSFAKLPSREFWAIGFLGGFTTFSSFSLETLNLLQSQRAGMALINILASVIGCLLATWVGFRLGARLA